VGWGKCLNEKPRGIISRDNVPLIAIFPVQAPKLQKVLSNASSSKTVIDTVHKIFQQI
jgi:hypothetical protein